MRFPYMCSDCRHAFDLSRHTYIRVMAHMNESCPTFKFSICSHKLQERIWLDRMNESCPTWMSHVPHEWVMSHIWLDRTEPPPPGRSPFWHVFVWKGKRKKTPLEIPTCRGWYLSRRGFFLQPLRTKICRKGDPPRGGGVPAIRFVTWHIQRSYGNVWWIIERLVTSHIYTSYGTHEWVMSRSYGFEWWIIEFKINDYRMDNDW